MKCVALPVGVEVDVSFDDGRSEGLASRLERTLRLEGSSVVVMQKTGSGELAAVDQINPEDTVFALVRCRAGGKGGFRKQLEKKGREFARAQRAEERAKRRSSSHPKKPSKTPGDKPQASAAAVPDSSIVSSMTTDASTCRLLAKQGVALAVAKALQNTLSTGR